MVGVLSPSPPSPVSRSAVVPPMRRESSANARVTGGVGRHQARPETRPEIAGTCPGKGGVMAWTSFGAYGEKIKYRGLGVDMVVVVVVE